MVSWPLDWNPGSKILYRECGHGMLHPDPDDAEYRIKEKKLPRARAFAHKSGCDMCCTDGKPPAGDWAVLGDSRSYAEAERIAKDLLFRPDMWLFDPKTKQMLFDKAKSI